MIARKQERERLLNEDIDDSEHLTPIKSINSKSSLKSVNILVNDNQNNIKLNETQTETQTESQPIVVDSASKQVIENLSKLSPNRGRVPLSQRLNSIARTYNWDESENIDYIDDNDSDEEPQIQTRSPNKPIRQTAVTPLESPPKKRLLLNERLNEIARTYDSSDDFSERQVSPTKTKQQNKVRVESESPTKRFTFQRTYGSEDAPRESKTGPLAKSPQKTMASPQKKQINEKVSSQTMASNDSKTPENVSPVKKPIESSKLKEKLTQFGFQKIEESVSPQKLIYNTKDNKKEFPIVNASSNVSVFRKIFEENSRPEVKAETPETLSLKAKTDLFEKVILSENEAKAKQYLRKRNAPQVKTLSKTILNSNNKSVETNGTTSDETAIKRQKSSPNIIETKTSVANNIFLRRQQLEAKLFGSETTTAKAYKKELEIRQNEIEDLKRPLKPNDSEKQNNFDEDVPQKAFTNDLKETPEESAVDLHYQSVDNETAHQTVCEAFQEIEEYPNEQSEDDSFTDNINYGLNSGKSQSTIIIDKKLNIESESPSKTRLYPQLFAEPEELCPQAYDCETNPPEKPPRVYQQIPETNTPTLRTISFYRRQQTLEANESLTPSSDAVVLNTIAKQNENNIDFFERNRKIQEKIDELNKRVEETNSVAGQASQALNLCLERDEFKSSTERVEAERVLLLSGLFSQNISIYSKFLLICR